MNYLKLILLLCLISLSMVGCISTTENPPLQNSTIQNKSVETGGICEIEEGSNLTQCEIYI